MRLREAGLFLWVAAMRVIKKGARDAQLPPYEVIMEKIMQGRAKSESKSIF